MKAYQERIKDIKRFSISVNDTAFVRANGELKKRRYRGFSATKGSFATRRKLAKLKADQEGASLIWQSHTPADGLCVYGALRSEKHCLP